LLAPGVIQAAGIEAVETVRYRLQQIATKTSSDPRTFAGLVDLICILETTDDEQQP
jgi:sugar diacid utilization regulator